MPRASRTPPRSGRGSRRLTVDAEWPPLVVHSRLAGPDENQRDVLASPWRADLLSLPAVSYRVSPSLLLGLLVVAGTLFVAAAAVILYRLIPEREPPPEPEPEPEPRADAAGTGARAARGAGGGQRQPGPAAGARARGGGGRTLGRRRPRALGRTLAWSEDSPEGDETRAGRQAPAPPGEDEWRSCVTAPGRSRAPTRAHCAGRGGQRGRPRRPRRSRLRTARRGVPQRAKPRAAKQRLTPGGRGGVVVIDVSLSIIGQDYARVRGILERLIRADNRMGLVVFSDAAYELLPPRTPARAPPAARFFTLRGGQLPPNPWTPSFQAGTRISSAVALAQEMLIRDDVAPASILLVSDLETAPTDLTALGQTLSRIERSSTTMRVVPLSPSIDGLNFFGRVLEDDAFVDPVEPNAGEAPVLDVTLSGESRSCSSSRAVSASSPSRPTNVSPDGSCSPRAQAGGAMTRRHVLTGAAALACLVVGVGFLLLALDVARAGASFRDDDVRYRGAPDSTLWQPSEAVPGIARRLLAVDDDILFRRGVRGVRLSHPETPGLDPAYIASRNEATAWLTDVVQGDDDPAPLESREPARHPQLLRRDQRLREPRQAARDAAGRFRQAIALDPGNAEAKFNLETALAELARAGPRRVGRGDEPVARREGLPRGGRRRPRQRVLACTTWLTDRRGREADAFRDLPATGVRAGGRSCDEHEHRVPEPTRRARRPPSGSSRSRRSSTPRMRALGGGARSASLNRRAVRVSSRWQRSSLPPRASGSRPCSRSPRSRRANRCAPMSEGSSSSTPRSRCSRARRRAHPRGWTVRRGGDRAPREAPDGARRPRVAHLIARSPTCSRARTAGCSRRAREAIRGRAAPPVHTFSEPRDEPRGPLGGRHAGGSSPRRSAGGCSVVVTDRRREPPRDAARLGPVFRRPPGIESVRAGLGPRRAGVSTAGAEPGYRPTRARARRSTGSRPRSTARCSRVSSRGAATRLPQLVGSGPSVVQGEATRHPARAVPRRLRFRAARPRSLARDR